MCSQRIRRDVCIVIYMYVEGCVIAMDVPWMCSQGVRKDVFSEC